MKTVKIECNCFYFDYTQPQDYDGDHPDCASTFYIEITQEAWNEKSFGVTCPNCHQIWVMDKDDIDNMSIAESKGE